MRVTNEDNTGLSPWSQTGHPEVKLRKPRGCGDSSARAGAKPCLPNCALTGRPRGSAAPARLVGSVSPVHLTGLGVGEG